MTDNGLRVNLYNLLLPTIQQADQDSGAQGFTFHFDSPGATWDVASGPQGAYLPVWDQVGLAPVIQELFYVIESMAGEELAIVETLDGLTDPMLTPERLLPIMARSYGYELEESLTVEEKRRVVSGLQQAFSSKGRRISYEVFFRLAGFDILEVTELFKKDINEANDDYSRTRYVTSLVTNQSVGPAGNQVFSGRIGAAPVVPGETRFRSGDIVLRDIDGVLVGAAGDVGEFDPQTGEFQFDLMQPAPSAVVVDYQKIQDEYPYHAARVDIELLLNPMQVDPSPLTEERLQTTLNRFDEVSPIHVKVRAFALVYEVKDEFTPAATDGSGLLQCMKSVVDAVPDPFTEGQTSVYKVDQGPSATDEMILEQLDTIGNLTEIQLVFEDRTLAASPYDTAGIDTEGAVPSVETTW